MQVLWSFEISEVKVIFLVYNIQTHHFTTFLHKTLKMPFVFITPKRYFLKRYWDKKIFKKAWEETSVPTDHHIPCAVPFEDPPVFPIRAVSHTELGGVVGLQVVFGALGLDPREQDFLLHVYLQCSKATEQHYPCQQVSHTLPEVTAQLTFLRTK